jgi:hypothetical protein
MGKLLERKWIEILHSRYLSGSGGLNHQIPGTVKVRLHQLAGLPSIAHHVDTLWNTFASVNDLGIRRFDDATPLQQPYQ